MDILDFREYVLSLPEVEECTPFDDVTLVYKVGGRMFACANMEEFTGISFHHDVEQGEALREQYSDVVPAWHFNKKYWNQHIIPALDDELIKHLIDHSYDEVVKKLTRKVRAELNL